MNRRIVDDAVRDPALNSAIATFNAHNANTIGFVTPRAAKELKKPLWDGEAHACGGDWYAAANHIRFNLRSYPIGRITKVISWSLITAYHDFLPGRGSGIMLANTPWCGHYEVQPPPWMLAHVNQFAAPGWRYLDRSCRVYESQGALREGLAIVSLRSPANNHYSVLIETLDAKESHRVRFTVKGGLATNDLACWRWVFNGDLFVRQADVPVREGIFVMDLIPNAVYSLTTTRGQGKGVPAHPVPEKEPFPFPFSADFEETALHQPGHFFSDVHGTFLVSERADGAGRCLTQTITRQGIPWKRAAFSPQTIIGDINWKDYRVEVDVQVPGTGQAIVWSHVRAGPPKKPLSPGLMPKFNLGYAFVMNADGSWQLKAGERPLAEGKTIAPGTRWHRGGVTVASGRVAVAWDGQLLREVKDGTFAQGVVALETGWNKASFDRVRVNRQPPEQDVTR